MSEKLWGAAKDAAVASSDWAFRLQGAVGESDACLTICSSPLALLSATDLMPVCSGVIMVMAVRLEAWLDDGSGVVPTWAPAHARVRSSWCQVGLAPPEHSSVSHLTRASMYASAVCFSSMQPATISSTRR